MGQKVEEAAADHMPPVKTVSETRRALTSLLRAYREDPGAGPVFVGSHRRADAVILPVAQYQQLNRNRTEAPKGVLAELKERRFLVLRLASLNKIEAVAVFGSVARGEESETSDVDFLVDPSADASLFDLAQFEEDMELLLARPVDVLSRRSLDPERDRVIIQEAVAL
ncbi:nucleotidyltransferase family protein [Arthrobacter pigmenti]